MPNEANTSKKEKQVSEEFRFLALSIESLADRINSLPATLDPITRPEPETHPGAPTPITAQVPLASELRNLRFRIEYLDEKLTSLMERIEL